MRVEALALDLRPRSMNEAADLGVRLVQSRARSVWRCYLPAYIAVVVLALATVEIAGWLPGLVIFWFKPWLDRTLLFVLSRAVFGEDTRWADVWRERSRVLWSQLPSTLTTRRLSAWRSFTQPAGQLEGLRGRPRLQRRKQLLNGQRSAALGMHAAFANIEAIFVAALFSLALWFAPQGMREGIFPAILGTDTLGSALVGTMVYAVVVFALEPFYVAAGFAMYLNRRVELEAWDIEQEFRRAFA